MGDTDTGFKRMEFGVSYRQRQFDSIFKVQNVGPTPLLPRLDNADGSQKLHIATVIPPFDKGSGGHNVIFQVISRLEQMGHSCSVWIHDPFGRYKDRWPAVLRKEINDYFAPFNGPVFKDFDKWFGADIAMATGWQTAHPVASLPNCRARTYMLNDHEPEFYARHSLESIWAQDSYRLGLYGLFSTPWLRELIGQRYGTIGSQFQFGVDLDIYEPQAVKRRDDTIVCYMRESTERRAVSIATLALSALKRERPDLRVAIFGEKYPVSMPFDYEYLGVLNSHQLAWLYSEATVGLSLSLTNFSLIPKEMMACGLPVVELSGVSAEAVFGDNPPLTLCEANTEKIAQGLRNLMDDPVLRSDYSKRGLEFIKTETWDKSAEMIEAGCYKALNSSTY